MSFQHSDDEDKTIYKVVINNEEQYSIWPEYKENPLGWKDAGKVGIKAECIAYIEEVWTDMRPLSLRKRMEELAQNPPAPTPSISKGPKRESLVDRLCVGDHAVVLSLGPEPSVQLFKDALDSGSLHVNFTDTEGGTELGLRVDKSACDFTEANFEQGTGSALVVGNLSLDYTKVRCVVNIDLTTLSGQGHLEKAEAATSG